MANKHNLSDAQERFAREYAATLDAEASYLAAGYSAKPGRSARNAATRLLSHVGVRALIDEISNRVATRLEISRERIVRELAAIAFADIRDFARWDNATIEVKPSSEIPDEASRAILEVTSTTTGTRIKMHDKRGALMDLARLLDLLPKDVDPTTKPAGNISITFAPAKSDG